LSGTPGESGNLPGGRDPADGVVVAISDDEVACRVDRDPFGMVEARVGSGAISAPAQTGASGDGRRDPAGRLDLAMVWLPESET
jgi:hypothetical protein